MCCWYLLPLLAHTRRSSIGHCTCLPRAASVVVVDRAVPVPTTGIWDVELSTFASRVALRGMAASATIGDALRPAAALAFGGLAPLLIYSDDWTSAAVLVGLCAAYSGAWFGWICFGPTPNLMAGFFWMFMYIFAKGSPHWCKWPLTDGRWETESPTPGR